MAGPRFKNLDLFNRIRDRRDLEPVEKLIAFVLGSRRNSMTGACFPRRSTIAADAHVTTKTVAKALHGLAAKGVIRVVEGTGRKGRTSRFEFLIDSAQEFMEDPSPNPGADSTRFEEASSPGIEKLKPERIALPSIPSRREGKVNGSCRFCFGSGFVEVRRKVASDEFVPQMGQCSFRDEEQRQVWRCVCNCRHGRIRRRQIERSRVHYHPLLFDGTIPEECEIVGRP